MKHKTINVYGEMHFTEDVEKIREIIVNQSPEVVLLESFEDDSMFYSEQGITPLPLEPYMPSLDFEIRERIMLITILESILEYDNVSVVLGDTHLRSESYENLKPSIIPTVLEKYGIVIVRSIHKEIS